MHLSRVLLPFTCHSSNSSTSACHSSSEGVMEASNPTCKIVSCTTSSSADSTDTWFDRHGIPQVQPHLQPQMPLQPQLPLQSQQPGITQHQLSELQDLHLRMQKLQMQMDQLTSSVQARRASAPTADSHSHGEAAPANPSESSGPGPCPFPPYPNVPRFEELDETESRTSVPAGSSPSSRPQRSPSAQGQSNQEVDLEQLLREGNRARAHSASVSCHR